MELRDQGPESRLLPHLCFGLCGFCVGQKPHPRPNPVQNSLVQKLERSQCRKRQFASNNRLSIPTVWPKWRADVGFTVPMCCWGWRRRVRGHRGGRDTAFSPNSCHLGWCRLGRGSWGGGVLGCGIRSLCRELEHGTARNSEGVHIQEKSNARSWVVNSFPQP